jgi:hypothetical protein
LKKEEKKMEVGIAIVCGISLGLIYIYKSVLQAGDDMETFDSISEAAKFKKPANWKVGKLPTELNPVKKHDRVRKTADIS